VAFEHRLAEPAEKNGHYSMGPAQMAQIACARIEDSGFTLDDLRSKQRGQLIVRLRHDVMIALYAAGYSYSVIGRFLDKDHASVINAVRGKRKP
jgi:chromosomal replication initiation ATPase DnaA